MNMDTKEHRLLTQGIEPEADAKCACGEWRLLRVSTTQAENPGQRQKEIRDAFQTHLDKTGGATASE